MSVRLFEKAVAVFCVAAAMGVTGCQPDETSISKTQADNEQAIRQLDADWVRVGSAKNVDGWMAFYADDAVLLPPNEPPASDRAAIRRSVAGFLSLPGAQLTWKPSKVEVAKSGELAYLYGTYAMSMNGEKGATRNDNGKILEVWKKQADGKWKCVADIWNSDLPG